MTKNSFSLEYLASYALDFIEEVLGCPDGCGDEIKVHMHFHDALLLKELMKRVIYDPSTKLYNIVEQKARHAH